MSVDTYDLHLDSVSMRVFTNWVFAPMSRTVLARSESGNGIFRVNIPELVADESTPEQLTRLAIQSAGFSPDIKTFDPRTPVGIEVLFGGASLSNGLRKQKKFYRCWYLKRAEGILYATYGCLWKHRDSQATREELEQIVRMLLSARFVEPNP